MTVDPPAAPRPAVRLRIDLGYDGTAFAGWARQPGQRTVQEVLQEALSVALRQDGPVPVTVAGRTDAGVHARGQVAHADVAAPVDPAALHRRLAALLPSDVAVRRVGVAPAGFDARFSALYRRYRFRIADDPTGVDPLRRHETYEHPRPLDEARMALAATLLLGEHDFGAFCRRRPGATTVRRLLRADCDRPGPGLVEVTVEADAFCHGMVRSVVGALLAVGDGRRAPSWVAELLDQTARDPAITVAPAHGLVLDHVEYPADALLADQAQRTRRRRDEAVPEALG